MIRVFGLALATLFLSCPSSNAIITGFSRASSGLALHIVSAGQRTQEGVDYAYLEYTADDGTSWQVVRGPGGWGNIYGGYIEDIIPLSKSQDISLVQVRARSYWNTDGADVSIYGIWIAGGGVARPSSYTVDSQYCDDPTYAYDTNLTSYAYVWSYSGIEAKTRWHTFR